jgi:copper transport protein
MRARLLPRLLAVTAIAGGMLLATAAPAWAHATLESTNPPSGGTVKTSPNQITLSFNENVEVSLGSIKLYDSTGKAITTGSPHHFGGSDRNVGVDIPGLADGAYIVTWRVISADAHPVHGAFTFGVGVAASASTGDEAAKLLNATSGNSTVGTLFAIARILIFVGLALLIGGTVFYVLIARGTSADRRTLTIIWIGWGALLFATLVAIMLQGPYAEGSVLGDAFKWKVISDILHTKYGRVAERRLVLLLLALPILIVLQRSSRKRPLSWWWIGSAVVVGCGLAATPGLAGHASTGDFTIFAIPLDTIHVAAMSVWLGGLVALVSAAIGGGFSGGLRRALIVFSRLAFWCVVTLVLTGVFASWRQVGFRIKGYTSTSYGNILLIKLGIVAVLIALAAISRSIVRARRVAPLDAPDSAIAAIDESTTTKLRKSVGAEVLVALAVLTVTALLVNAQPARSELAPRLYSTEVKAGTPPMLIDVTVDPAKAGPNTIHVYTLTPAGANLTIRRITATMSLPSKNILSMPTDLQKAGPNHYLVNDLQIPIPGKWRMTIHVLRRGLNDTAAVIEVPIR